MTDEPNEVLDKFIREHPPEEHEAGVHDALKRLAKLPPKSQTQLHKELHESGRVKPKPKKTKTKKPDDDSQG
jgi:hypothetical protein